MTFLCPEDVYRCEMCGDYFYGSEIVMVDGIRMCIYCAETDKEAEE